MKDNPNNITKPNSALRAVIRSRAFLVSLVVLIFYTLCGFFLVPYLVKHFIPKAVQEHLGARAGVGAVRINPFVFTFEAEDFRLSDKNGEPIVGFDRLLIDFELSSLFRWAWTFRTIALDTPAVHFIVASDGRMNIEQLIPRDAEPQPQKASSSPPRLVLQNISIRDGEIDIIDRRQSTPATFRIRPLNLNLDEISTLPERKGPYTLAFTTLDGEYVKWAGDVSLRPLRSAGRLEFSDFRVASLWEFARDDVNLALPEGRFGLSTAYAFDFSGSEPRLTLDNLEFRLVDLKLRLNDENDLLLGLDRLEMSPGAFDLASRRLDIGTVRINGGQARVAIDEDGNLNFNGIVRAAGTGGRTAENKREEGEINATDLPWQLGVETLSLEGFSLTYLDDSRKPALGGRIGDIALQFGFEATVGPQAPSVSIKSLAAGFKEILVGLQDNTPPAVRVEKLDLEGGSFELAQRRLGFERIGITGGGADAVRLADGGINLLQLMAPPQSGALKRGADEVQQSGTPIQFEFAVIEISEYTATISDRTVRQAGPILELGPIFLKVSDFDGKSPSDFVLKIPVRQGGTIAAEGRFDPAKTALTSSVRIQNMALPVFQPYIDPVANIELHSGLFSTAGRLQYDSRLTFEGGIGLTQLLIKETGTEKPLLSWKAMDVPKLKLQTAPNRLEIDTVKLVAPFNELIINADGSVNLARVFKQDPGADRSDGDNSSSDQVQAAFPIRVNQVRVQEGKLNFADLSLTPQFAARIHNLNGAVVGLSTGRNDRARIEMDGQVDQYGSAKVGGEINAFDPTAYTDVTMVFKNLEMSSLTPYSAKFAGRRIRSGKLSLELEYKIENRQLLGDNQIVVDRLELGETVDSPESVSLPLDLAVALLEDSRGVIDIGLPVRGDLNNPEFSIGHLVWKALVNLLTRIVTSPFNALAGLMGVPAQDLDAVAFEPGKGQIPPPEREKLKVLAEALKERPQLALVVQGRYASAADGEVLKSLQVRRSLAERSGRVLEAVEDPGPVDFGDPKTQQELEFMYAERFGQAQLAAQMQPPVKDAVEKAPGKAQRHIPPDPAQPYKELYRKLVESETLPERMLVQLADDRAMVVVAEVTGEGGVSPERVTTRPSEPSAEGDAVAAKLTLEVLR